MNYLVTIFLLAAGICWMVPDAQGEGCGYAQCIIQSEEDSKLDVALVQFYFYVISGDFLTSCPRRRERFNSCRWLQSSCPRQVTKPWDQRLTDDRYIFFLVELTKFLCDVTNRAELDDFVSCIDTETTLQMRTCVSHPYKFTAECVLRQFRSAKANNGCRSGKQVLAQMVIDVLLENPYSN